MMMSAEEDRFFSGERIAPHSTEIVEIDSEAPLYL